jgi:hypothetical protein
LETIIQTEEELEGISARILSNEEEVKTGLRNN